VSVTENGVIYVCTGWTGTGSVPASGSGFWTPTFSLTQGSSLTWNWQVVSTSGGLLNLPAPSCYSIQNLIDRARLTSVSSGQTVTVSPGQQFSVNYGYQIWQGSNQSEIDQLLFICSWTPTWPPSSAYYNGIYSSIPPSYPGNSGSGTASFTAPSTPGTYYIWLCFGANYGYPQAASTYTTSLSGLPAPIKVVVSSTPTPTSIHTPETSPNNVISTDGGNFASPSPSGMVSFQSINSSQQNMVISYFILGAFGLLSLSAGISAFINRRKSEHFLSLWVLVSGILLLLSGAAIAGSFAKYTLENYGGFLLTMIGVAATLFGIVGDATKRKRYKQILANRFAEISLPSIWACAAGLVFAVDGSVTANQWAKDTIANSLGFGGLLVGICCLILGSFGVIGSVATGWTQKIPDWGKALVRRKVLFLRSSLWVIAFGIILFAVGGLIAMSWAKFTVPNTIGYWVSLIGMGILAIGGAGSLVTPFMFVRKYKRIPIVGVHGAGKSYFLVSLGHLISERGLGGPGDKDTNIFLSKALTYILLGEKIPPTLATSGVEISLKEVEAGSKVIKTNLILTSRDFRGQLYEETMSELMSGAVSEESNKFLEMYRQSDGLIVIIDLVRDVDATQFNGNREFYVRKAFAEQISPLTMGIEIAAEKWHKKKPVFFVFTKSDVHNLSLDELNFYLQRIMASTLARLDQLGVSIRVHSVSSYGWTKRGQTVKLGDLEAAGFKDLLHDIGTCCEQGLL
jgi:GTPase SAR1 family protein